MIRMLIPLIILLLVVILLQTFNRGTGEKPIDVDPVNASTGKQRAKQSAEDDVIDVEPVEVK